MKKGKNASQLAKNQEGQYLLPEQVQRAVDFVKNNKGKTVFPEKYFGGLKMDMLLHLQQLCEDEPDIPLKEVVIRMVKDIPEIVPADKILELTAFVISKWEALKEREALVEA